MKKLFTFLFVVVAFIFTFTTVFASSSKFDDIAEKYVETKGIETCELIIKIVQKKLDSGTVKQSSVPIYQSLLLSFQKAV